ncbi:3beta-hydroxysteroid-dehydrogenase/decarboxylase isoform 3 [Platanthera zijinensis]|uniref:Reticulon-like protein n=1 Tax=Platanthera zijinensis TaxID=2320716 RepID=A0AAP0BPC1_9ASPA
MAGASDASMIVTVIFGRSSFIGRSLVAALLSDVRFTVRVVDPLPAPDPTPSLAPFFQSGRVSYHHVDIRHRSPSLVTSIDGTDAVFHVDPTVTALQPPPAPSSDFQNLHLLLVQSTRNVISACLECRVQRLVYVGSADAVIGGANDVFCWDESVAYPDKFVDSLSELRAQAETMVLRANKKDGPLTCALRASNPFGPGDDNLVPFLVKGAKEGWAKFIIGNGKNSWDFTYIENVAHASICAELALRLRTPYVAGRPFFITNQKPMKFWDFLSNILEGLGYQRPSIHIPANVVLSLAEIARFFQEKLFSCRTSNSFITSSTLRSFISTRTFDCSNAERVIGYSPVVSLEDGISLTIESFSQLANCSPSVDHLDLSKPSKAEKLLGNQSAANLLLWRDDRKTFICLLALFLLHYWFFLSERTFISSAAKLLMLFALFLFVHGTLPSSMRRSRLSVYLTWVRSSTIRRNICCRKQERRDVGCLKREMHCCLLKVKVQEALAIAVDKGLGFSIEKIPLSSFEIPELTVRNCFSAAASLWNICICALGTLARGEDWGFLLKVASSLYLFKLLLRFSLPTVSAAGLVCLFSFFIVYEQCEREIESSVAAGARGLRKMMGILISRLPSSVVKYVS